MLPPYFVAGSLEVSKTPLNQVRAWVREGVVVSAIGHAETAALLAEMLGVPVQTNRMNISIRPGDEVMVAQYIGPRLPEGATTLPEGAQIQFFHVLYKG
jgi:hypothetical protein